ncbi:MFS transporter [Allonocardiopsis opalescens]|uniref:Putative MFS family arabinose efflux permease n=1 Tax=Allonocardiopsis opalescens TaxID=1144618 RepID=A0A2T0Q4X8_9ACTN|nr:MFS transporter [Allonocardiopsis opalescens]PRX98823.1 putative MFS family arabinose efflux permease [Allonocardiopsis opalescens]
MDGLGAPLRHRAFVLLCAGRWVSMFGNAMAPIALAFAVLDVTDSTTALGVVVGAASLAKVVFVLVGGVVADRLPRNLVLVGSNVLSAASQGAIAALVLTGTATIPLLTTLALANGMMSAFALPASAAMVPQTVPTRLLRPANALMRLGLSTSMVMGASLGGLLVAAVGPGWGLAADALCFAASGLCFALLRVPAVSAARPGRTDVLADLRDGWREFTSRTWVWVVVLGFMFVNAAYASVVHVLGPAVADDSIGRQGWGFVLAAQTAGMIVGALIATRVRVNRLLMLGVACMAGEALLPTALALHPGLPLLMAAAFTCGLCVEQFGIAWEVVLQSRVPQHALARVYSYDMLGSFVAIPLAQLSIGPIAAAAGTAPTLLGVAAVVLTATAGMLASRSVRTLGTPAAAPADAAAGTDGRVGTPD